MLDFFFESHYFSEKQFNLNKINKILVINNKLFQIHKYSLFLYMFIYSDLRIYS